MKCTHLTVTQSFRGWIQRLTVSSTQAVVCVGVVIGFSCQSEALTESQHDAKQSILC